MYKLEIETKNHLRKIRNPRKAKASDWILRCVVFVMDGDGKWHFIGHCFYLGDAESAVDDINSAIKSKKSSVVVEDYLI